MVAEIFRPKYTNSWALVIGINKYQYVSPLQFARNDAEAVAELLSTQFNFPESNVHLLVDEKASRMNIIECFLQFTDSQIDSDDRIFVFFAGHGTTKYGRRGEIGYLIPYDAQLDNLASFIRWDDLTKNSELIKAKHILFVMDACYGGLALNRALRPGSMRFVKDMLQRYTRQVLTAGKADEPVLDAGGPLPNHSIFTGHFLEGLQGKAATSDGIITANGIMAYVYERVGKDYQSIQIPHYGFLDGDGDFIFNDQVLDEILEESEVEMDKDALIAIPATVINEEDDPTTLLSKTKEYVADIRYRVKLHDLIIQELRKVLTLLTDHNFPIGSLAVSTETVVERLKKYENIMQDIQSMFCVMSHWGVSEHQHIIGKVISHLFGDQPRSGVQAWLSLRSYPVMILMYCGGIGAIASNNYGNFAALLTTKVGSAYIHESSQEVVLEMGHVCGEIERLKLFKLLPEHERYYVPRSEYLFKLFQPKLDDILFLGRNYEELFDRFEVMFALVHADLMEQSKGRVWGPSGRFSWKHRDRENSVYSAVLKEAQSKQDTWAPLQAGLFGGSYERFQKIAKEYEQYILRLGWS